MTTGLNITLLNFSESAWNLGNFSCQTGISGSLGSNDEITNSPSQVLKAEDGRSVAAAKQIALEPITQDALWMSLWYQLPGTKVPTWKNRGLPGGWTAKYVARFKGQYLCIGADGNIGAWDPIENTIKNPEYLSGWKLKNFAVNPDTDELWCVGTDGNVGIYKGSGVINDLDFLGGWKLNAIAMDNENQIWCIGETGVVATYNQSNQQFKPIGNLAGWTVNCIAFDYLGKMWCVGTDGNVGVYHTSTGEMEDIGNPGDWDLQSISFDGSGNLWGVNTEGYLGNYENMSYDGLKKVCAFGVYVTQYFQEFSIGKGDTWAYMKHGIWVGQGQNTTPIILQFTDPSTEKSYTVRLTPTLHHQSASVSVEIPGPPPPIGTTGPILALHQSSTGDLEATVTNMNKNFRFAGANLSEQRVSVRILAEKMQANDTDIAMCFADADPNFIAFELFNATKQLDYFGERVFTVTEADEDLMLCLEEAGAALWDVLA